MATYLLTWNPDRWHWDGFEDSLRKFNKAGKINERWSVGVTKKIVKGDRVFLMKLGKQLPRGIVASGYADSGVSRGPHWNEEERKRRKTTLYVDVTLDMLLDKAEVFPKERLSHGIYTKQNWEPQASGISIKDDVAEQLEEDWAAYTGQPPALIPLAEEVPEPHAKRYVEGSVTKITINAYERNSAARKMCIEHHGLSCAVCGMNFEERYGEMGRDFIHVHHLRPLSSLKAKYLLDPIRDLVPVCPNCHAMLHQKNPPLKIDQLKAILKTDNHRK